MASLTEYLKDTRAELTHVNWPTQRQATAFTILVIAISILVAFLLFAFDSLFITLLERFILS
ncbi:MAG: preprotein translocase subunit SecE [Parcubacteria group bacterium RIFOXYD2_FULL_52_8]|nr:MAG: preprotein translocase subunit SecE [Parcubacteria group bacterium RIFOXYD2_FULL_52_8]